MNGKIVANCKKAPNPRAFLRLPRLPSAMLLLCCSGIVLAEVSRFGPFLLHIQGRLVRVVCVRGEPGACYVQRIVHMG